MALFSLPSRHRGDFCSLPLQCKVDVEMAQRQLGRRTGSGVRSSEQCWGSCRSPRARRCWKAITTQWSCWRRDAGGWHLKGMRLHTASESFRHSQSPGATREHLMSWKKTLTLHFKKCLSPAAQEGRVVEEEKVQIPHTNCKGRKELGDRQNPRLDSHLLMEIRWVCLQLPPSHTFFPLLTHPLILLTQRTPNSHGGILPKLEKIWEISRKGALPPGKEGRAPFLIFEWRAWSHLNPRGRSCDKPCVQQLFDQDVPPN